MASKKHYFEQIEVHFDLFDWHGNKQVQNLEKHHIDFDDAITIFDHPVLRTRSDRGDEIRYIAVGLMESIVIAVVYTERNGICRVISARRAREYERKAYHEALPGGP